MSGKLDRARPIFVCWSERSAASDYREIVQCGHAPASADDAASRCDGGFAAQRAAGVAGQQHLLF